MVANGRSRQTAFRYPVPRLGIGYAVKLHLLRSKGVVAWVSEGNLFAELIEKLAHCTGLKSREIGSLLWTEFIEFTHFTEFIEFTQMSEFIEFTQMSEFNEFSQMSEFNEFSPKQ